MRRVLLAGFVIVAAVLGSAGVAEAGSLDHTGGDAKDGGHHRKHEKRKSQNENSDASECSGCGGEHENEPVDYCEECADSCADIPLNSIPGLGAIPVVRPSESDCDDR